MLEKNGKKLPLLENGKSPLMAESVSRMQVGGTDYIKLKNSIIFSTNNPTWRRNPRKNVKCGVYLLHKQNTDWSLQNRQDFLSISRNLIRDFSGTKTIRFQLECILSNPKVLLSYFLLTLSDSRLPKTALTNDEIIHKIAYTPSRDGNLFHPFDSRMKLP